MLSRLLLLALVIAAGAGLVWFAIAAAPEPGLPGGTASGVPGAGRGGGGGRGTGGGTGGGRGGHRGAGAPAGTLGGLAPAVLPRQVDPAAIERERAARRTTQHDPDFDWREQVAVRMAPELVTSALADFVDADGVVDARKVKSAFPGSQTARPGETAGDEPRMVQQGVPRAVKHFVYARVDDPEQVRWIAGSKPEARRVGGKPAWVVRVRFSAPDLEPVRQDRLFFLQHDEVVWVTDVKER